MDKIKVGIRIRPLIKNEIDQRLAIQWAYRDNTIYQIDPKTGKKIGNTHVLDYIFNEKHKNEDLFNELVQPILESVIQGYNGTIFAYGQTSSGKTHTMNGNSYDEGIIPRSIQYLFQQVQSRNDRMFLVRASYLEIYNEIIIDLLTKRKCSKIRENLGNIVVADLQEEVVDSPKKVLELLTLGNKNRQTAGTAMNEQSSRSHAIFRIIIESRGGNDDFIESQLNLVDLAGSEKTDLNIGNRFKEGCAINKSLFMLSKVISQLSEQQVENQFISFRDSKLTRILQNSLGGNSLTAIICAITPTAIDETMSTIGFALRAKKIHVNPFINEIISDQALLKKFQQEIESLQMELNEKDQCLNILKAKVLGASSTSLLKKDDIPNNRRMTWHRIESYASPQLSKFLNNSHKIVINSSMEFDEFSENKSIENLKSDNNIKKTDTKSILTDNNTINIRSNTITFRAKSKNKENFQEQSNDQLFLIERENNDLKMELELLKKKFRIREEELLKRLEHFEIIQSRSIKNDYNDQRKTDTNELLKIKVDKQCKCDDRVSLLEIQKLDNEKKIENLKNQINVLEKKNEQLINSYQFQEERREIYINELNQEHMIKCQQYENKIKEIMNVDEDKNKELINKIHSLEKEILSLNLNCDKNINNNQIDVQITELKEKIAFYEENLNLKNNELKEIKNQLNIINDEKSQLKSAIDNNNKNLELINENFRIKLDNKNQEHQKIINDYELQITILNSDIKSLTQENEEKTNIFQNQRIKLESDYQKQVEENAGTINNFQLKIDNLNKEHQNIIKDYELQITKLNVDLKSLLDQLNVKEILLQNANEEKFKMQSTLENFKLKVDKLNEDQQKIIKDYEIKLQIYKNEEEKYINQLKKINNFSENVDIDKNKTKDDSLLLNEIQDYKLQMELLQKEKAQLEDNYEWAIKSKQEKLNLLDENIEEINQLKLVIKKQKREFKEMEEVYEIKLQQYKHRIQNGELYKNDDHFIDTQHRCKYSKELEILQKKIRKEIDTLNVEITSENLFNSNSLKSLDILLKCIVKKNSEVFNSINEKYFKENSDLKENIKKLKFDLKKELNLRQEVENLIENYDRDLKSSKEEYDLLLIKLNDYKMLYEKKQTEEMDKINNQDKEYQKLNNTNEQHCISLEIKCQNQEKVLQELNKTFKPFDNEKALEFKATQTSFISDDYCHPLNSSARQFTDAYTSIQSNMSNSHLEKSGNINITSHPLDTPIDNSINQKETIENKSESLIERQNLNTDYALLKNDYRKLVEKYNILINNEETNKLHNQYITNENKDLDPYLKIEQMRLFQRLHWLEHCRIVGEYSKDIEKLKQELLEKEKEINQQKLKVNDNLEILKNKLIKKETDYALLKEFHRKIIKHFNEYKCENPSNVEKNDNNLLLELNENYSEINKEQSQIENLKNLSEVERLNKINELLKLDIHCQWHQHFYLLEECEMEKEKLTKQLQSKENELIKCRESYLEMKINKIKNEKITLESSSNLSTPTPTILNLKMTIQSLESKLQAEKEINEMLMNKMLNPINTNDIM